MARKGVGTYSGERFSKGEALLNRASDSPGNDRDDPYGITTPRADRDTRGTSDYEGSGPLYPKGRKR